MKPISEYPDLKSEKLLKMYRDMVLLREFEEACPKLYSQGKMGGFLHLYSGEEAVAVGVSHAMRDGDCMISSYREHGHILARGADPKTVMAELFGKANGISKGKGGSMHLASHELNFMGGYGIVGGHLPLAVGLAFAAKYLKTDQVTVCLFGDGATNQGVFHEAMNMAALYHVPVIFVCENNGYGIGTSVERASSVTELYKKSCAYKTPGHRVDGMNVLSVYQMVKDAVELAREGGGPTYIEAATYRFRGHSISDPGNYRSPQEKKVWQDRDPIPKLAAYLLEQVKVEQAQLDTILAEERQRISDAIAFADASPDPAPDQLMTDIYVEDHHG